MYFITKIDDTCNVSKAVQHSFYNTIFTFKDPNYTYFKMYTNIAAQDIIKFL